MAFMGGGNPISVAANFRLVFDTRSATRTATQYDAAMAQIANKGTQASGKANQQLVRDHEKVLKKVKKDNEIADTAFKNRSDQIFNHVARKSKEAFLESKKAAREAAKGPKGGTSSAKYKKAAREYTASLAVMDTANKKYMAGVVALGMSGGSGIFDSKTFGGYNPAERKLAIEETRQQLELTKKDTVQHQILSEWLEEQLQIDRSITAAEKDLNRVRRQGGILAQQATNKLRQGQMKNNVELKKYKQNLMDANMQLQQMGQHIKMGVTQALMTSAIVLVSFGFKLARLTEQFKEFQNELQNANSIWQESNEVLFEASDTIVQFSTKYGIALNDATKGLYQMASAGLEASEAQAILGDTLKLSMAVQGDHETLSKLTIQTIKGFGLQMSDSAELTDKFAYAINKSLLEWQDLASAVKFAMPFFTSTGQSVEQLLGALEVLTNRALEAGIAGRGLRQALAQFAKHADDNTAAFRKMGIEILNNEGEFKQFTEIAKEFSNQFGQNLNDTEMMTKLLEDLNVRGATAFIHLVQNADEFSDAVTDLENAQGAAAQMADIQNQSLENQLVVMKNAAVASFFMSDSTYENLGAMNEFHYLLQTATNDLRDFLFVQTEAGLILSEVGENLKTMVNTSLVVLIQLMKEAYTVIGKLAANGSNLGGVIQALVMPLKLAVQLLGHFGEGALQTIIMFKVMNSIIPMNTMLMMANAETMVLNGQAVQGATFSMQQLAGMMAIINLALFGGILAMNRGTDGYYRLGQVIVFLAGAMQMLAVAKAMLGNSVFVWPLAIAGGFAYLGLAMAMKEAMKSPELDLKALPPLEYTTMDTGGVFMPRYMDMGGTQQEHGLAMLQKGETVTSKTQNMQAGEQPLIINVQGDIYDGDMFAERVAEVLPNTGRIMINRGMI